MGTFFKNVGGPVGLGTAIGTGGLSVGSKSDWGMHPSLLWQRQPGPILNSGPWSGQAATLAGAKAGYTPQSYVQAASGYLDPGNKPNLNTGGY